MMSFLVQWNNIVPLFREHLRKRETDAYRDFLAAGLPYHLPFSFLTSEAECFASELKAKGWQAVVVPSELG